MKDVKTKSKKPVYKRKWFIALAAIFLLGAFGSIMDSGGEESQADVPENDTEETGSSFEIREEREAEEIEVVADEEENVPTEYISALNKAKAYSETMHMSKASLYEQLTSEYGEMFSEEAGQHAIDNVNADWKENALNKAQTYSETMHMSKTGLFDQLVSEYGERFTKEEAQYAVDNVEANWKQNALIKARNYQETMDMSPERIREQLTSDYGEQFTPEEADYAVDNL